ncbi:WD repeat-containing protein 7 [Phtheirospermum japonicum]|uniref:WD repeat-containing protein 7 n=1 Tax=Phtheirospermum japonicum TaxID=374723 RepID=A0A830BSG8_9LAMI|nr:WD repeat-containing protein 7 [Phtheirospermum japonicum]
MKCRSLACIWSGSPPAHRVTAVAALHEPPTLYTGGSDGSIICWNLISSSEKTEMKPVAMLCGHAAPIADLGICFPFEASENGKLTNSTSVEPTSINNGSLISACSDGVLCVWSRTSGHCRRRRKLPPWVGSPVMIRPLPNNIRYVCVTCCFVSQEQESLADRELQSPDPLKCTVVIVDSFTLTIVHTVFHGNLSLGPLKSITVVLPSEEMEKQCVLIIDSFGKVLYLPIVKEPTDPKGVNVHVVPKDFSISEVMDWADDLKEKGSLVSVADCGYVVALVHRTYCTFRQADNGAFFGKIYFSNDQLCSEGGLNVVGGIFIGDNASIPNDGFVREFVVWNNRGRGVIYKIYYSSGIFKFDPLSVIPAVSHPSDVRLSFFFVQLDKYLLRIESICFSAKEHKLWRPHVTVWLVPQCEMIGQGNLLDDWDTGSFLPTDEGLNHLVSSSMVISENHLAPYAIVYGFFNGDIEIVMFHKFFTASGSIIDPQGQKRHLSGHDGAVLCLASHQMVSSSGECSLKQVLLSGSMDCTVRVWDLDSGKPIMVLHQHVAPVRQIILPPCPSDYPWSDCFLTVGDDSCVALVSLQTMRVERLFPGHLYFPAKVLWDGLRNYIACLCPNRSEKADALDILYIWDVKTGARERVLRGAAAHSMLDHFLKSTNESALSGNLMNGNTSASSLVFPVIELTKNEPKAPDSLHAMKGTGAKSVSFQSDKHPIKSSCPFPGLSTLCFDLNSLMSLRSTNELSEDSGHIESSDVTLGQHEWVYSLEGCLLQFSLSFLHLWNVDKELDDLLVTEMKLKRPDSFLVSSGILGDRGSMTLTFPGSSSTLELWRSSSEYSALRSLTMVSLAQHLISLSHSYSSASRVININSVTCSALAAFYMRKFAEKISDIKPPLLQLLVSFWQNEFEHVKMAARSLFHCAASRAIPLPLFRTKSNHHENLQTHPYGKSEKDHVATTAANPISDGETETEGDFIESDSEITSWLESYEVQDWISCVGGTTQDAMTSQIIVAAALSVWYPSLVKRRLSTVVVHSLLKLVMAMNEKYSAAAAEILAEGMESTWKACIGSEIPRLIGDIFFQVECVSGNSTNSYSQNSVASVNIRETLVGILLPSLAMADIPGYLHVIESQIWSTASDSPVHVVALMTLIRVVRGSPRNLAPYLDKVAIFILQTMDPGNSTMRRSCLQSSMTALKEVVRVFPMTALNDTSTRLAVGDAIGEISSAIVRVYDMQSGPPGLPNLLGGTFEKAMTTAISALSFSPDGEGIVAFSENGLMIRWWSLGSVWWEKLSRSLVPVQCTKVIFVPPWEGFSPTYTRSSIMANVLHDDGQANSPGNNKASTEMERLKLLIHNLDLSYRLEWVGDRKVKLSQHSLELGTFQL